MAETKKRELDMDTLDLAVGGAQSNSQENKDGSQGVQQTNKNGTNNVNDNKKVVQTNNIKDNKGPVKVGGPVNVEAGPGSTTNLTFN